MNRPLLIVGLLATILALLIAGSVRATVADPKSFDVTSILQNAPKVMPYIATKMQGDSDAGCRAQLLSFATETSSLAERANLKKPSAEMVENTICKVDPGCITRFADVMREMFNQGGMVEKIARRVFGEKGVDLQAFYGLFLNHVSKLCDSSAAKKAHATSAVDQGRVDL